MPFVVLVPSFNPPRHSRENGNPAAGSPARRICLPHRRRGALDPRLRGDDDGGGAGIVVVRWNSTHPKTPVRPKTHGVNNQAA